MNAYEVENIIRSWLMAVAYTTPHKISDLDMRIHSAGCDVHDGDFIHIDVMRPDENERVLANAYVREASVKFTGTRLSSVQMSEVLHNITQYWERLK